MKKSKKAVFILDTSAILTYIEAEEGSDSVEKLLIDAEKGDIFIYVAFVSIIEIYYITTRKKDEKEALKRIDLLRSLAITIEESNDELNIKAARLKAKNRISFADAFVAALSQKYHGTLVHKDPEFEKLLPRIKQHILPYKK